MTSGELAFTAFIESLGITAEWSDIPSDRQAIWEYATEEWIRANVRRSGFSEKLTFEMNNLVDGLYRSMPVSPLRQSREFLLNQVKTAYQQLNEERQKVKDMRGAFQEWSREHPSDDDTALDRDWIKRQQWKMCVHIVGNRVIEFDQVDGQWWAWTQERNSEFAERQRLALLETRGDFRRLLKCLGVPDDDDDGDIDDY